MGWLLLWTGIGLLQLGVLAGCGWILWRKSHALYGELRTQGRTLGDLVTLMRELELPTERNAPARRSAKI